MRWCAPADAAALRSPPTRPGWVRTRCASCRRMPFRFQFGPDSQRLHLQEAQRTGLSPQVVRLPGLEFDVDSPADLDRLGWTAEMARATSGLSALLRAAEAGRRPDSAEALAWLPDAPAAALTARSPSR